MANAPRVGERTAWLPAVGRGFLGRCPACGRGRLFCGFLKVADRCEECGTAFHHHRADDLPPYIVIFLVGHLVGWGILTAETRFDTPLWLHLAVWPALALILCLGLLQPAKGAVVGLQYALGMHGFAAASQAEAGRGEQQEGELGQRDGAGPYGSAHGR
jgi:uncharacterized protein (DUF983 family)